MSNLGRELAKQIIKAVDDDGERLKGIYKDLHQNPELGFMETRTAGIVAKELKALGYEVKTGIGKTGVVGIMKNGDGPTIMYRADMDAISVKEETGLPYASTVRVKRSDGSEAPVGHMCGHDAHTTWLLGLAKVMAGLKDQWHGTLILLGQPSEETIEGATAMANDGLFTKHGVPKPDNFIGLHTMPFPTGMVVAHGGVLEAGTEQLDVTFHGVGAHGSSPQYSKDAALMAALAVIEYQAIVSRVLDPRDPAVITVGAIHAGTENNTIPDTALLKLNFRFFDPAVREKLYKGVKAVSEGIARTYGMPEDKLPTIVRKGFSTPLVNSKPFMERAAAALTAAGVVEKKGLITEFRAITGSEDAGMLVNGLEGVEIAYLFIGTADPKVFEKARIEGKEFPFSNHQPNFAVDLAAIPLGAKVGATIVMDLMAKDGSK